MNFRLWLENRQDFYIRFGKVQGASNVYLGKDFDRKGEYGVSVYQATRLTPAITDPHTWQSLYAHVVKPNVEHWQLQMPNSREAIYSIGSDYWNHMLTQYAQQNRPIYLLTGTWMSQDMEHPDDGSMVKWRFHGADGEPLLDPESFQIIKELQPEQVMVGSKPVSLWYDKWAD